MEYNLNFMHPQYGTIFNADIDASFSVAEMEENLVLSGFLPEHEAGYQLALGKKILDKDLLFDEILDLEDGDVIRVIPNQQMQELVPDAVVLQFFIKHPSTGLVSKVNLPKEDHLSYLVETVLSNNFVHAAPEEIELRKGDKILDLSKSAADNGLDSGDYLQVVLPNQKTPTDQLSDRLGQIESKLQNELQVIKDNMPSANFIPVDPTRAVNPTMDTYESIDTIVNRLRASSKQQPLQPIRIIPIRWFLMAIGLLLVTALVAFVMMNL